MSDDRLTELLHEVADRVEPDDRLDAIRDATSGGSRRTPWAWWAAGGAGLVAASVITALALTTGGTPQGGGPEPAPPAGSTSSPTPDGKRERTDDQRRSRVQKLDAMRRAADGMRTIYYVGDTPDGPRLFLESRETGLVDPIDAATEGLRLGPLDPDHRSPWPADAIDAVHFDGIGDEGEIGVVVNQAYRDRPADVTPEEAALAVEQVVRTFQTALDVSAPVRFYVEDGPVDSVLGVPTSEPVTPAPDLDVLSPISLLEPVEGQQVDNDEGRLPMRALARSDDSALTTRIQRWEATYVVVQRRDRLEPDSNGLTELSATFDLQDAPPGDYAVISEVRGPDGVLISDTRRFTVVD